MKEVILVDDDESVRFLISMQLSTIGIDIKTYEDVLTIEKQIQEFPEELENTILLLDVNLPHKDGDVFLSDNSQVISQIEGLEVRILSDSELNLSGCEKLREKVSFWPKNNVLESFS